MDLCGRNDRSGCCIALRRVKLYLCQTAPVLCCLNTVSHWTHIATASLGHDVENGISELKALVGVIIIGHLKRALFIELAGATLNI